MKAVKIHLANLFSTQSQAKRSLSPFLGGTIFGAILGSLGTLFYQYFRHLLRQPRLTSKAVLTDLQDFDTRENRALFIATENLYAGIAERQLNVNQQKLILHAGYRNFRESWARDFGFACYGLLALQKYQPVKETLQSFFWYQTSHGQLPVKLQSMHVFNRFVHSLFGREQSLEGKLTPKYTTGHGTVSLDGQALIVIAACNYIAAADDLEFAHEYWEALQLSLQWMRWYSSTADALLHQPAYSDWADSVARPGAVLYTNVVYWKALQEMARVAAQLDYAGDINFYGQTAQEIERALNEHLWRPHSGYFATSKTLDNLSSAGNLLAAAWGLADEAQSHAILDALQAARMAHPVPTQAAYPAYQPSQIAIENRLGGLANYHTEGAWLWIGAWHLIALCRMGRRDQAQRLLERIGDLITRDQQIHEVYGLDGKPLSSFWYQSEAPLTWNAAMLIYAFQQFEQHTSTQDWRS